MTKIEEKIDKASESYVNTCLNRCRFHEKRMRQFDAYDLVTAFEQGAKWALSHQWVNVDDALPEIDKEVLFLCEYGTFIGYFEGGNIWFANGLGEVFDVTFWLPIPPLPEARKECVK